jgi:hypothetical protein
MPKYAPPREDGLKPYVVDVWEWGHGRQTLVYAVNAADARYQACGRSRPGIYAKSTRRATPADMPASAKTRGDDDA